MLSTVRTGKPCAAMTTEYSPTGKSWKANWPSLVDSVACSMPVALLTALTWAPGTTAPDGSVTVPLIAPRNVCAVAGSPTESTNSIATISLRISLPHNLILKRTSGRPWAELLSQMTMQRCLDGNSRSELMEPRLWKTSSHTQWPCFNHVLVWEECNATYRRHCRSCGHAALNSDSSQS